MAKDETQIITEKILTYVTNNPQGAHTSEIAQAIGHNRITVGKYLDILCAQGKVAIRRIGQAKVFLPASAQVRPRILIVDDEPHVLDLIALTLGSDVYDIVKACDGEQALGEISAQKPDVIILDLMMPKMNGYEVCQRVKENVLTQHIPIIILSAKTQVTDKIQGMKIGADDYVTKPFDPLELEARIAALLRREHRYKHIHPLTGLPDSAQTATELSSWRQKHQGELVEISFDHLDEYFQVCGYKAGGDGIRLFIKIIKELLDEYGQHPYIGHKDYERIVAVVDKAAAFSDAVQKRFIELRPYLYSGVTIKDGYAIVESTSIPLLNILCKVE